MQGGEATQAAGLVHPCLVCLLCCRGVKATTSGSFGQRSGLLCHHRSRNGHSSDCHMLNRCVLSQPSRDVQSIDGPRLGSKVQRLRRSLPWFFLVETHSIFVRGMLYALEVLAGTGVEVSIGKENVDHSGLQQVNLA